MKNYIGNLARTNEQQIEFGRLLDLDFTGLTVRVAVAMVHAALDKIFNGKELKMASEKQIELGACGTSSCKLIILIKFHNE
jgi:hypothetical protein